MSFEKIPTQTNVQPERAVGSVVEKEAHIREEIESITDGLGKGIDPGIKESVVAFKLDDFPTNQSCEGHSDEGLPFPWVEVGYPYPKEGKDNPAAMEKVKKDNINAQLRMTDRLEEFYMSHDSDFKLGISPIGIYGSFRVQPEKPEELVDQTETESYRKEMSEFTNFMLDRSRTQEQFENYTQDDINQELLRNSELGYFLEQAYVEAVQLDPRLGEVVIKNIEEEDNNHVAYAKPGWSTESGNMEMHIRLNDLDEVLARHQEILDTVPGSRELFSEIMGLKPEEVTPAALHIFSMLHEMGHITEYFDFESNPDNLSQRNKKEKAVLPIGNASVGRLIKDDSSRKLVLDNWSSISKQLKISSYDELLKLQHIAYRNMTSEKIADKFAEDVFATNPDIVNSLTHAATIQEYRDY